MIPLIIPITPTTPAIIPIIAPVDIPEDVLLATEIIVFSLLSKLSESVSLGCWKLNVCS